jgi:hypothetical protein
VLKGSPVRGLAGDDPGSLEIILPGSDAEPDGEASAGTRPPQPDDPADRADDPGATAR